MTLKRTLKEIVESVFWFIPVSAVIGILVWFFCELLLNFKFGSFMNIWKWSYIVSLTLWIILQIVSFIYSMSRMFGFSKRIGAKFADVEEAVWVFGLHKKHSDFFSWDLKRFTAELRTYKEAKSIADTVFTIMRRR